MNILLVNPRFNGKSEIPPLGLATVAAPLLEADMDVAILDLDLGDSGEAEGRLLTCLKERRPSVVGVTALSHSFASALKVFESVKAVDPGMLTVLGGIHGTVLHERLLRDHGAIDAIVRGEGEDAFLELVRCFIDAKPFDGILGISFRRGRRIVRNGDRPLAGDLDRFPQPAHHLIDGSRYRTRGVSSSRGCARECTFCSIRSQYRQIVRFRGIGPILDEIQGLLYFGAKRIMFTDDNFTFSMKRIRHLCGEMVRQGFKGQAAFYAQGRMDDLCRHPILAGMLADAGFQALYIGAESGSQEILDYYEKGIHPDDILRGASLCVEQNLTPVVNFILFGPKDRPDTIRETIGLARRLFENGAEIAYTEALIPYPGTPIQQALAKDGKYREDGGVFYFEPYHDLKLDRFLLLCDAARELTRLIHGGDPFFDTRKTYYELSYLDQMLGGAMPPDLEACRGGSAAPFPREEIEALYGRIRELLRPAGGP